MTAQAIMAYAQQVGTQVGDALPVNGNLLNTLFSLVAQMQDQRNDYPTVPAPRLIAPHESKPNENGDHWVYNAEGEFVANFEFQKDAAFAAQVLDMLAVEQKPPRKKVWAVDVRIVFEASSEDDWEVAQNEFFMAHGEMKGLIGTLILNDDEVPYPVEFDASLLDSRGHLEYSYIQGGSNGKKYVFPRKALAPYD